MKALIAISLMFLTGCVGTRLYAPVKILKKDGQSSTVMAPVAAFGNDFEGNFEYTGHGHSLKVTMPDGWTGQFAETTTTDKKGNVIVSRQPVIARFNHTNPLLAFFRGLRENVDSFGNMGLKAGVGAATAGALAPATSAIRP